MTYDFAHQPVNDEQRALSETNRQTAIQIFERCANHLLAQGKRSMAHEEGGINNDLQCAYRGDAGLMCGVGCLIADEHYTGDLEGQSANSNPVSYALQRSGVEVNTRWYVGPYSYTVKRLLEKVQELHDKVEPEDWRDKAADIAESLGLTKEQA
jgi:hypothetical protein